MLIPVNFLPGKACPMGTGLEMEVWVFSWHLAVSTIPAGGRQKSLLPQANSWMQMNSGAYSLASASKSLEGSSTQTSAFFTSQHSARVKIIPITYLAKGAMSHQKSVQFPHPVTSMISVVLGRPGKNRIPGQDIPSKGCSGYEHMTPNRNSKTSVIW